MAKIGTIRMPSTIYYGVKSIEKIGGESKTFGKRALIISDRAMERLGYVDKVQRLLLKNDVTSTCYLGVDEETTDIHVAEAVNQYKKENCQFIIAIGGGSCIDAAKACAVLVTNDTDLLLYVGEQNKITHPPVPVIAIPTTAGTGSEVTDAMVVTHTEKKIKMMIKQPILTPAVAIVDPELTTSAPQSLTVATGIDALSHAIESFLSTKAHPFTDELALSSIRLIAQNIRLVYEDGTNLKARTKMARASMQAGIAFSNASVALVHGMSRPIGALFHVPHGISNAMLLAPVLEFSLEQTIEKMATIGRCFDPSLIDECDEQVAKKAIKMIKQLCSYLQIPNLKQWGINEDEYMNALEKMTDDAFASGSPSNHPKVPSKQEMMELYKTCYTYAY